ncbi:hypothetical protein Scep_018322 [Stephania cephalantha]|uniref:Myb/SANT-like DNA-binding domain-containing protein n=1 Tax=Stephania cephalantha TaxID=152367 RepID=A0AAP0IRC0_9MAGN
MALVAVDGQDVRGDVKENAVTNAHLTAAEDDGGRAPRLPRWTRQEILVLIQGKKVAENRVRRGRGGGGGGGSAFGAAAAAAGGQQQLEPKWVSVSSYCKRHGVNRGPVQCRKRWSNLAGDFKKIKEWESSGPPDSFWVMRTDSRRERKLPGFFDREVYDMLDGAAVSVEAAAARPAEEEDEAVVFDSGRTAAADEGLFSDFEPSESPEKERIAAATAAAAEVPPWGFKGLIQLQEHCPTAFGGYSDQGIENEKRHAPNPEKASTAHEGQKRRRLSSDEIQFSNLQEKLIKVLDRNSRMLMAQLEAQNINCELDRDQRKDQANSLVAVLSKLADAVGRIADKL